MKLIIEGTPEELKEFFGEGTIIGFIDESKLTDDEKRIVSKLTDKLIEFGAKEKISRTELFSRLSTLVEGIKLGLQCRRY